MGFRNTLLPHLHMRKPRQTGLCQFNRTTVGIYTDELLTTRSQQFTEDAIAAANFQYPLKPRLRQGRQTQLPFTLLIPALLIVPGIIIVLVQLVKIVIRVQSHQYRPRTGLRVVKWFLPIKLAAGE